MANKFIVPNIIPPIIAHRGAPRLAPENTLAAFRMASVCGAKCVEFDVMLAACGTPVVFHDETLERTTFETGRVIDFPYEHLKKLDAGSWFDPIFRDEKISPLMDVLKLLDEYQLAANIEIKTVKGKESEITRVVLETVFEAQRQKLKIPLFFSSFSVLSLEMLREISAEAPIAYLLHDWESDWEVISKRLRCIALNVRNELITFETMQALKSNGHKIFVWTINDPLRAQALFEWGVDAIYTDVPDVMINRVPFLQNSS